MVDPDGYDAASDAANKAHSRLGKGPKDCGGWMRGNFPPGACPDGSVDGWPTQMKKMPNRWEQLPNNGNQTSPGTVISTGKGNKDNGHVEIIDPDGQRTSASIGHPGRTGKETGKVRKGKPITDQWVGKNGRYGKITLWRFKG